MDKCIFCDILQGKAPASMVYEDDLCFAFMDIRPVTPGHVLVIPRAHAKNLTELDEASGGRLFQVGQKVAQALRQSSLKCEGVNFFLADGEAAGQEVFHVHLHVFPRFHGDGFGLRFSPAYYGQQPARDALDAVASSIRQKI